MHTLRNFLGLLHMAGYYFFRKYCLVHRPLLEQVDKWHHYRSAVQQVIHYNISCRLDHNDATRPTLDTASIHAAETILAVFEVLYKAIPDHDILDSACLRATRAIMPVFKWIDHEYRKPSTYVYTARLIEWPKAALLTMIGGSCTRHHHMITLMQDSHGGPFFFG
jgi:hypothetical protein